MSAPPSSPAAVWPSASPVRARRRVLIIAPNGSYRIAPFLGAAQRLGIEAMIASDARHALTAPAGSGLSINLREPASALRVLLREAQVRPFDAVVGTDDSSTELAAALCARLGLPHNPVNAVRIARRKDLARARLAQAGVPVPWHRPLDLTAALAPQLAGVPFPCVVKPVALSASRGVIRADDRPALLQALARLDRILSTVPVKVERDTVLLEQFVPGREVAVEGLLSAGRLDILALFDKPDLLDGPYFEETHYITPSRLDALTQALVRSRVAEACAAYGLREGPVHAECRLNEQGVWILEVAARTIGGLCARLLRFGTGHGLEELVLAQALGERLTPAAATGAAGVLDDPDPAGRRPPAGRGRPGGRARAVDRGRGDRCARGV